MEGGRRAGRSAVRVYLGIKYHADNRNRELIGEISEMLTRCGFMTSCVVRDLEQWGAVRLEARALMQKTFEMIDSCDIVLIELSEKGVGLGIEAGYAYAKGIPVVTVAKRGSDVSETLRGISEEVAFYDDVRDLEPFFSAFLGQEFVRGR